MDTGERSHSSTIRMRATTRAYYTPSMARPARSHGTGEVDPSQLAACGDGVVFEPGALVFHPENIEIGDGVYVGHYAILKGYYRGLLRIGRGSWIGQHSFLHAAGDLSIGERVGIGPGVCVLTSTHRLPPGTSPIIDASLELAPVVLESGCDIGARAVILPGSTVGRGAQVGAGAVVKGDVEAGAIVAGVPARVVGKR